MFLIHVLSIGIGCGDPAVMGGGSDEETEGTVSILPDGTDTVTDDTEAEEDTDPSDPDVPVEESDADTDADSDADADADSDTDTDSDTDADTEPATDTGCAPVEDTDATVEGDTAEPAEDTGAVDTDLTDELEDNTPELDTADVLEDTGDAAFVDTGCEDADGDGSCAEDDCDESDATVNPGASETCNSIDDDCDGSTDEGLSAAYWPDVDGDGYGDASGVSFWDCTGGSAGYVANSGDCDDSDATVNPGESEVLDDGIDQDCDGDDATLASLQEEAECENEAAACFVDADEDGNYETLLMDDSQWTSSSLYGDDAEVYADLDTCGINGDTAASNDAGYYVVDFDAIASSCTARVSLIIGASWWQNYDFCAYDDVDGICVNTGGYNYLIEVDWNASAGLAF